jgi:hypothetical protein
MSTVEAVKSKSLDPQEFRRLHSSRDPRAQRPRDQAQYDELQKQQRAQVVLSHYQMLMNYAIANEKVGSFDRARETGVDKTRQSIPQTRAYFQKVALGIDTEPIIKNWFNDGL